MHGGMWIFSFNQICYLPTCFTPRGINTHLITSNKILFLKCRLIFECLGTHPKVIATNLKSYQHWIDKWVVIARMWSSFEESTNWREGIIVPLDRRSGQLKSTLPGHYRLSCLVYTGGLCRRGRCRRGTSTPATLPLVDVDRCRRCRSRRQKKIVCLQDRRLLHRSTSTRVAGVEDAGVEKVSLV